LCFRLEDIGLRKQDKAGLLLELLIPTIFSIILVIQLHFFHKPLMNKIKKLFIYRKEARKQRADTTKSAVDGNTLSASLTSSTRYYGSNSDTSDEDEDTAQSFFGHFKTLHRDATVVLWRFAEIHWPKFVSLVVVLVSVQQVSSYSVVLYVYAFCLTHSTDIKYMVMKLP